MLLIIRSSLRNKFYNLQIQHNLKFPTLCKQYCDKNQINKKKSRPMVMENDLGIPEPPTTCCMSGCNNCVWILYAEKLSQIFRDGGERAQREIMEKVTDSNMRAFLNMELRNLQSKTS